jgi:hypothetical protein
LATTTGLADPWQTLQPSHPEFATRDPGSKRIDSVLFSPSIYESITGMGYSPIARFVDNDHRGVCLEFMSDRLLGPRSDVFPRPEFRGVKSTDKGKVTAFVEAWYSHLVSNSVFNKLDNLNQDALTPQEVETLDGLAGQGCQAAENRCRQRRPEWYSQPLVQARIEIQLLRCQLRALVMGTTRQVALTARAHSAGVSCNIPNSKEETGKALQIAQLNLKQLSLNSGKQRENELRFNANQQQQHGDLASARILQRINKSEISRRTYTILQAMKNRGGTVQWLDKLEIPASWPPAHTPADQVTQLEDPTISQCEEWRTITDPMEIEYFLMLRNRLHFGQAQGTPFTVPPLSANLDWCHIPGQRVKVYVVY